MIAFAKRTGPLLLIALAVSTVAVVQTANRWTASTLRADPTTPLASCGPSDQQYADLFFRNLDFDQWPERYHTLVSTVVEEYNQPVEEIRCQEDRLLPVEPSQTLYEMAGKLPPWSSETALQNLERNDVGFVLLEFLRIYECALMDRKNFTSVYVQSDYVRDQQSGDIPLDRQLSYGKRHTLIQSERRIIEEELNTARPTLEKVLQIITGNTRLSVLDAELQCLQRASLDMRNALSLAADTSSCLPRIWNAKDVLRSLPQ